MYRRRLTPAQRRAIIARRKSMVMYKRPYYRGNGDYQVIVPSKTRKGGFNGPRSGANLGGIAGGLVGGAAGLLGDAIAPGIGAVIAGPLSKVGSAVGRYGGQKLGEFIRKVTGYGRYNVEENSLMAAGPVAFGDPKIRIRRREFVANIESSNAFRRDSYDINIGNTNLFKWGSTLGLAYQQHEWHGIIFEFVSLAYNASGTNTSTGAIAMATNYNSAEPVFLSLQDAMAHLYSSVGKPTKELFHGVECARKDTSYRLFYNGQPGTNEDPKTYNLGKFQLMIEGCPSANDGDIIGQLWVSYDCSLTKVSTGASQGKLTLSDHWYGTAQTATGTLFFNNPEIDGGSTLDGTASSGSYVFPPNLGEGRFLVVYFAYADNAVAMTVPTLTTSTHINPVTFWQSGGSNITNAGVTDNVFFSLFVIELAGEDCSFNFSGGTIPSSGNPTWDLCVTQIPSDMELPDLSKIAEKAMASRCKTIQSTLHRMQPIEEEDEGPKVISQSGSRSIKKRV